MRVVKGFSLLEVMVSMVIAAIALLGLAAAQIKAMQFAQNSFNYTIALIHGQNAIERIWPDICHYQSVNTSLNPGTNPTAAGLYPNDPRFTLTLPDTFSLDMSVSVSWHDERMTDTGVDQISLHASFVNVCL
ncbi:type IV pilus modification PilV family protein [Pseudoalteromonas ardens]|uniref:N-terminal cleavage protein n=1 Tax=Pseudoalteromonas rubra TaxID=43658 RepID=A0A0L0EQK5_9GAMM|nr:prepilin-type N-terminal cleavage/methylation domain-containing protein [Pseudoalteromonas sp. R96]KNC66694.1 N-terminal cleavage protein [Pseudoalteromonas rubra]MDK1314086.1 prepilin-type N-terminal cleavage/methylation domain-containing protein [Pseudoalteromonas sp. R96]